MLPGPGALGHPTPKFQPELAKVGRAMSITTRYDGAGDAMMWTNWTGLSSSSTATTSLNNKYADRRNQREAEKFRATATAERLDNAPISPRLAQRPDHSLYLLP
ncbi:hypothetical protein PtB15_1B199 [Puccinia triticina]|nr:hypothetical protein PtB15_1B199 [Puccinia triticina]